MRAARPPVPAPPPRGRRAGGAPALRPDGARGPAAGGQSWEEAAKGSWPGRRLRSVLLAIDQGTTGTTCLVVGDDLRSRGRGYRELSQSFPAPGLVEQDAEEIWETALDAAEDALAERRDPRRGAHRHRDRQPARDDRALGSRDRPAGRARDRLAGPADGGALRGAAVRADPRRGRASFPIRTSRRRSSSGCSRGRAARPGDLAFGTVDSWLVWRLTGEHVTTSRTPRGRCSSTSRRSTGTTSCSRSSASRGRCCRGSSPRAGVRRTGGCSASGVAVTGIAGDQQAALFGQACFAPGRGQGDLRHRQLRARERGRRAAGAGGRRAGDGGLAARG